QIGYNWQVGSIVSGVEWDFEYFNPKGSKTATGAYPAIGAFPSFPFTFTQSSSGNWLTTLRGRLGFAWDNWLVYGTVGVAAASLSFASAFVDTTTAPPLAAARLVSATSYSAIRYGFVGGAGVEWGFAPNWSIRGEYLYTDINGVDNTVIALPTTFAGGAGAG